MKNRIRRFFEALYRLTFEVGANEFSTFGYYPDSDAPLSPVTGFRAHYTSEDNEYVAMLLAHSADPGDRP